jgi:hypothetical protein
MRAPSRLLMAVVPVVALAILTASGPTRATVPAPKPDAVATPTPLPTPPVVYSPIVPPDVPQPPAGYADLDPTNQTHFDVFSWKSFAAVNWPMSPTGNPLAAGFPFKNNQAPRQWEQWVDPNDLFRGGIQPICPAGRTLREGEKVLHLMAKNSQILNPDGTFTEPDGNPLIDVNLNYALYEIRLNPVEARYITSNGLTTRAGQQGKTISFTPGSIEVKAVWRIMAEDDDLTRYYSRPAVVYVPAANSSTNEPLCLDVTVGLAGMHIVHKTPNFPAWIWSSFEHVDNAPTSPPSAATDQARFSFYSNAYRYQMPVNTPPTPTTRPDGTKVFLWTPSQPYAQLYARESPDYQKLKFGTQVVRSNSIYPPTAAVTATWQTAMRGTPWANYMLIGSQWVGGDTPPQTLAIPAQLANSGIETYIQATASCVQCHSFARAAAGQPADFSFLLALAQ